MLIQKNRSAIAGSLAIALFACSDGSDEQQEDELEIPNSSYTRTSQGNSVSSGFDLCILELQASPGRMRITYAKDSGQVRLTAKDARVYGQEGENIATWSFDVVRKDGTVESFPGVEAEMFTGDSFKSFSNDMPIAFLRDFPEFTRITFRFEDAIASEATPKGDWAESDWAEESKLMSDCIGTPLAELTGPTD